MKLKTKYKTVLTAIEKKTPNHSKYFTTPEFNRLAAERFSARLAQENLANQNDIANFVKKTDFDDKIFQKKTKHILAENNFKIYRHSDQVLLLVKVTVTLMQDNSI